MRYGFSPYIFIISLVLCSALIVTACGGADAPDLHGKPRPQGPPTRQARAVETQLDALAADVASVTDRVNYLVAADRLHALDIADGSTGESVVERRQDVLTEIHRYRTVLVHAAQVVQTRDVKKRVRPLRAALQRVIKQRLSALRSLEASLSKEAQTNDAARSLQHLQWVTAWNQSIGAARRATNEGQALRSSMGLPPAREDAFR